MTSHYLQLCAFRPFKHYCTIFLLSTAPMPFQVFLLMFLWLIHYGCAKLHIVGVKFASELVIWCRGTIEQNYHASLGFWILNICVPFCVLTHCSVIFFPPVFQWVPCHSNSGFFLFSSQLPTLRYKMDFTELPISFGHKPAYFKSRLISAIYQ